MSRPAALFFVASGAEEKLVHELLTQLASEPLANCHPLKKSDRARKTLVAEKSPATARLSAQ